MRRILFTIFMFLFVAQFSFADIWYTNIEEAVAVATEEDKDILVNFTGSDWCGWCIRLDKEVFSTNYFKEEAVKDFVMVKLDFPSKIEQSEETKAYNAKWQQAFQVKGFPTIFLTSNELVPYAKTGYLEGGSKKYVKNLQSLKKDK